MSQTITINGRPIAKQRPRFARIGKGVHTYSAQAAEEGRWILEAQQQVKKPLAGPLTLSLVFAMPRPKHHYGTGKNLGKLKDSAPLWHTGKPDLDNLAKFVKDCLNGVAWQDDSQVCRLVAQKVYSDKPQTVVCIEPVA